MTENDSARTITAIFIAVIILGLILHFDTRNPEVDGEGGRDGSCQICD